MPSVNPTSSFLPSGVRADDDQDALRLFPRGRASKMDAVGPAIDRSAWLTDPRLCQRGMLLGPHLLEGGRMVDADRPGASLPTRAASASSKSPVEMPFR